MSKLFDSVSSLMPEHWRPEERKDFFAEFAVSSWEAKQLPDGLPRQLLMQRLFNETGELVQSLTDGETHVLKVSITENCEPDDWPTYPSPPPMYRLRARVVHSIPAQRTIVDTRLKYDAMSCGELQREFWRRVNRKRKKFGLGWLLDDFLKELERLQGWA